MAKKRLLTKDELHAKAVRLVEGGAEEIDGHWVRFKSAEDNEDPCCKCMMECVCQFQMVELCYECVCIAQHEGTLALSY